MADSNGLPIEATTGTIARLIDAGEHLGPWVLVSLTLMVCVLLGFVAWLWFGKKHIGPEAKQIDPAITARLSQIDDKVSGLKDAIEDGKRDTREHVRELGAKIDAIPDKFVSKDLLDARLGGVERAMTHFMDEFSTMMRAISGKHGE